MTHKPIFTAGAIGLLPGSSDGLTPDGHVGEGELTLTGEGVSRSIDGVAGRSMRGREISAEFAAQEINKSLVEAGRLPLDRKNFVHRATSEKPEGAGH